MALFPTLSTTNLHWFMAEKQVGIVNSGLSLACLALVKPSDSHLYHYAVILMHVPKKKKIHLSIPLLNLSIYLTTFNVSVLPYSVWREIKVSKAVSHDCPWNHFYSPLSLLNVFKLRTVHLHTLHFILYLDQRLVNNSMRTNSRRVLILYKQRPKLL